MASHQPTTPDPPRRRGSRPRGARSSHTSRLDVPRLEMGSTMTAQLAHERNGRLLSHAGSSSRHDRSRILAAMRRDDADLRKAQPQGHCDQLTARLAESLLHHLLFAKGQLTEPVSLLRKRRLAHASQPPSSPRQRSRTSSSRLRKQDKLLARLDQLRHHLEQAANHLAAFAATNGEGPSRNPYPPSPAALSPNDLRLLVVIGASAAMPREVFVLDLIQAIGRCSAESAHVALDDLLQCDADPADQIDSASHSDDLEAHLAHLASHASNSQRSAAREKTSNNWERKLVRLLVGDRRLESFLGSPLAPTRMHLFLSAPASFRCPGWSARQHLDFDLDPLCEPLSPSHPCQAASAHPLCSVQASSCSTPPRARSTCESSSSVTDSGLEDSASEHPGESSISSLSEDSRPPSAADKSCNLRSNGGSLITDGCIPRCSSPLAATTDSQNQRSLDLSRTGSSLGSSTVYAHDPHDVVHGSEADTDVEMTRSELVNQSSLDATSSDLPLTHDESALPLPANRRRSREPKAGSLLSRNLIRGHRARHPSLASSDSCSVRSLPASLKRTPRLAGIQIDFSDPATDLVRSPAPVAETLISAHAETRCWFQCEAVLEGFR